MKIKVLHSVSFFVLTIFLASAQSIANSPDGYLSQEIIDMANTYYLTPYPYKAQLHSVSRKIGNKEYVVQRPNHASLHADRKASYSYVAVELLRNKNYAASYWIRFFTDPKNPRFNPNFEDQLAFGMLMLRTGRSSEGNTRYKEDSAKSAENLVKEAPKTGLFPNKKDIDDFEFAIQTIGDPSKCFDTDKNNRSVYTEARGCTSDRVYIYNWLYGIHHVDLRRMVGYNKDQVLSTIASYLSVNDPKSEEVTTLWEYAGMLLKATGDSDLDTPGSRWGNYANSFFILSADSKQARDTIVDLQKAVLEEIRIKSGGAPVVIQPPLTAKNDIPVVYAQPDKNDPWYAYALRPTVDSASKNPLYPANLMDIVKKHKKYLPTDYLPWTFVGLEQGDKKLQGLSNTVPDRWVDPVTGKRYIALYHGTTSDILDVFKQGEKAVRFDVAANKVLGMGFYLTASLNEAKFYSCLRLKERKSTDPSLQAMVVIFGIEENDLVKGKYSVDKHLSDDTTGDPLDKDIFFKRNQNLYNQFNFFTNTKPLLKMSKIVILPKGFEAAELTKNSDFDGRPTRDDIDKNPTKFSCPY